MPGWLTDHLSFCIFWQLAFNPERQSAGKLKTKNGRLASVASLP